MQSYLEDFAQGRYPFLWVVGRPGVAKTESVRAAVRGRPVYYRKGGQLTPLQFYLDCYQHRGRPIILDDAEHLLENKVGLKLVSALGDTTVVKQMSYGTTARALGEVPPLYETTSALCIIANRTTAHEEIQSRAVTLFFDPTNLEVHRAVARWFWDQEIHDWFGRHLHRLPPLEARWYVTADRDKRAGRDWARIVLAAHSSNMASTLIQDLEADPAHPTREDKVRHFVEVLGEARGASRASYFRMRRRLEEQGRLAVEAEPTIPLRRSRPPGVPSALELESMGAVLPDGPEGEPYPLDVPAREAFARPIQGNAPAHAHPAPLVLDDSLPWEAQAAFDEEEGE